MNLSVSPNSHNGRCTRLMAFSLAPRWRIRYSEGKSQGTRYVRTLLTDQLLNSQPEKLRGSKFDTPEDLAAFSQRFDEGMKKVFSNDQGPQHVKFGSPRDNDHQYGIKAGRLMLTG